MEVAQLELSQLQVKQKLCAAGSSTDVRGSSAFLNRTRPTEPFTTKSVDAEASLLYAHKTNIIAVGIYHERSRTGFQFH